MVTVIAGVKLSFHVTHIRTVRLWRSHVDRNTGPSVCYAPAPNRRGIKRCFCLTSDVCLTSIWRLSIAYIGPKSRTQRPKKTKIGTEVAHVTRDSDTTFRVKRSKVKVNRPLCSPPCWRVRRLQRWAWEHVGRGKLLLRVAVCSASQGASAPTGEGEGRGIPWRPRAYSLFK